MYTEPYNTIMEIDISGADYSQEVVNKLFQSITESDYYKYDNIKEFIGQTHTSIYDDQPVDDYYEVAQFYCDLIYIIYKEYGERDIEKKDITISIRCSCSHIDSDYRYLFMFERKNKEDSEIVGIHFDKTFSNYRRCPECGCEIHVWQDDFLDFDALRENRVVATCDNCSHELRARYVLDDFIENVDAEDFSYSLSEMYE